MHARPIRFAVAALALATLLHAPPAVSQCTSPAPTGLDVAGTNSAYPSDFYEALGQTFAATGTAIGSITVWQPAGASAFNVQRGAVLVVTRTLPDPTDGYRWPDFGSRLATTGVVHPDVTTDPAGPYALRFTFDPPLALPAPDLYAFFVYPDGPTGGYNFSLAVERDVDAYPAGIYWITDRHGRYVLGGGGNDDLNFVVQYCTDAAVPARHSTWGALKQLYR